MAPTAKHMARRCQSDHEEFEDANFFGVDAFLKMTCLLQNSQFDRFSSQNVTETGRLFSLPGCLAVWLAQPSWMSAFPPANRRDGRRGLGMVVELKVGPIWSGADGGECGQLRVPSWSD